MGSSSPKPMSTQQTVAQGQQLMQAEADINRYGYNSPFGSRSWQGGTQSINLSPEMQGVFDQLFASFGQEPQYFESGGLMDSPFAGPAQQAAGSQQAQKQRVRGMNHEPGMGGHFQAATPLQPGQTAHGVDNAASAREAAALYQELVPMPEQYDPMRYQGVYEQMFGGRLGNFNNQYGRNR